MTENIKDELNERLIECKELMSDESRTFEERKFYGDLYLNISKEIRELEDNEETHLIEYAKIGLQTITIGVTIFEIIYKSKFYRTMALGYTSFEQTNNLTTSFGKDVYKKIQGFVK